MGEEILREELDLRVYQGLNDALDELGLPLFQGILPTGR